MKTLTRILSISVAIGLMASAALADPLSDAKHAGKVGEQINGYLGAVTPDGAALAASINAQRKAAYEEIAKKNNQPLDVVEKLAAVKAIEKAAPGTYVQDSDGKWVKK